MNPSVGLHSYGENPLAPVRNQSQVARWEGTKSKYVEPGGSRIFQKLKGWEHSPHRQNVTVRKQYEHNQYNKKGNQYTLCKERIINYITRYIRKLIVVAGIIL